MCAQIWAVVFPTWPSFVLLIWTELLFVLPRKYFVLTAKPLLGYIGVIFLFSYFGAVAGNFAKEDFQQWSLDPKEEPSVLFGNLCLNAAIFWSIVLSVRKIRHPGADPDESSDAGGASHGAASAATESGITSVDSGFLVVDAPEASRFEALLGAAAGFVVNGTYLLAVLVVFIASLDDISVINAIYLLLITV